MLYTDWLARKGLYAALGVKEEDMLGVGDVERVVPSDEDVEAPATDPAARRRQVEAFIAASGGDV